MARVKVIPGQLSARESGQMLSEAAGEKAVLAGFLRIIEPSNSGVSLGSCATFPVDTQSEYAMVLFVGDAGDSAFQLNGVPTFQTLQLYFPITAVSAKDGDGVAFPVWNFR